MDWLKQVGAVLDQYENAQPERPPKDVEQHFDTYSRIAPEATVADGLAAAFRSDRTPPFGQMVGQLFGRSPAAQRSSILGQLLRTLGPAILARKGISLPSAPTNGTAVPPDLAERISPEQVQDLAHEAEKKDPTIIDRISEAYARHPEIVRTLGTAALTIALAKAAQRQRALP